MESRIRKADISGICRKERRRNATAGHALNGGIPEMWSVAETPSHRASPERPATGRSGYTSRILDDASAEADA